MTKNPRERRAKAKFNLEQKRIRMRVIDKQHACRIKIANFKEFPVKSEIYGIIQDPLNQVSHQNFKILKHLVLTFLNAILFHN